MSRKRVKQYLMLLIAVGLIAMSLSGSTFASFNAETANPGNTFATGTLFLHDSVNGNTACTSESVQSNQNVPVTVGGSNPGDQCDVLFNFDNTTAYNQPFTVDLALSNAGTIDGSDLKFQLNGTGCQYTDTMDTGSTYDHFSGPTSNNGSVTTTIPNGTTNVTSIDVAGGLTRTVPAGSTVIIDDGSSNTDTTTATATADAGDTTLSVAAFTASNTYTANTAFVATLSAVTSIELATPTQISIADGSAVQIDSGGFDTFTVASGPIPVGSSTITVSSHSVPTHHYSSGDTVYSALGANDACDQIPYTITETNSTYDGPSEGVHTGNVDGSTGDTDTFEGCAFGTLASSGCAFDDANNIGGIPTRSGNAFNTLTLSSGGGTGNAGTGVDASGGTRYFIITVFPRFGDPVMGETATFDLVWHMDQ
jgi:predicted ribosomally synthesized peptide with SipW-like signal peptide